jgi:drug/metabolite transporter (DMT)-like permease
MAAGGVLLLLFGTAMGEWSRVDPSQMSTRSLGALAYLVVFGSLIAFAAYVFLLRHEAPARVGSYAYVNPVVAVFLGWALAAEPVTPRTIVAAAIILTGVVLIVRHRAAGRPSDEMLHGPDARDGEPGLDSPETPCAAC